LFDESTFFFSSSNFIFFPPRRADIFTGREMGADGPPPPLLDSEMALPYLSLSLLLTGYDDE
jgi:hypothetical protein